MTLKESSDESTVVYVPRTNILALNPADPGLTGEMLHTLRDHVPHAVGAQTAGHERVVGTFNHIVTRTLARIQILH